MLQSYQKVLSSGALRYNAVGIAIFHPLLNYAELHITQAPVDFGNKLDFVVIFMHAVN